MTFGEKGTEHEFKVTLVSDERPRSQFEVNNLEVTHKGTTRKVAHLWWRDWPDKGVPKTSNGIGTGLFSLSTHTP
jgi:protein tyrosine phosphatase